MSRLIYTYDLVKSLYDQGEDYIDSFWPFLIRILPRNKTVDIQFIQHELRGQFNLDIPFHVLGTILTRVKRNNYIKQDGKRYSITSDGARYLDTLESEQEVERRIESLIEDIRNFFLEKGITLNIDQTRDLVFSFFKRNLDYLVEFVNPALATRESLIAKPDPNEKLLIEYVGEAEKKKPEFYKILQDILLGSIISVILYAKDSSQVAELGSARFEHCKIYLDTNFVFFLLGLHTPEFNEPAKELFNLLKKQKFDVKIFSFTIDEMCRVIRGYDKESYRYPVTIEVNTLYSSLKAKGWKITNVIEFTTNVYDILEKNGVTIEWIKNVDVKNYQPSNKELGDIINRCKPGQGQFSHNHDLAAIEMVRGQRGNAVRKLEYSKALFLTADVRLSVCNFAEMGHRESGTVCEVILDRVLTNILWLKNPGSEPPLKSVIASHSRDLFIKRSVWDKFYDVLHELKKESKVSDEAMSMLFYHKHIESVLRELDEADIGRITPVFIISEIEKVSQSFREKEIKTAMRAKEEEAIKRIKVIETEFFEQLKSEISKKDQEKKLALLEQRQIIEKALRESAEKLAKNISLVLTLFLCIIITAVSFLAAYQIYVLSISYHLTEFLRFSSFLMTFLFGPGLIKLLFKRVYTNFKNGISNFIYLRKLKEIKI